MHLWIIFAIATLIKANSNNPNNQTYISINHYRHSTRTKLHLLSILYSKTINIYLIKFSHNPISYSHSGLLNNYFSINSSHSSINLPSIKSNNFKINSKINSIHLLNKNKNIQKNKNHKNYKKSKILNHYKIIKIHPSKTSFSIGTKNSKLNHNPKYHS